MRNAGKRYSPVGLDPMNKFLDAVGSIDPKAIAGGSADHEQRRKNESVEAKWEQLQYYESNQWQQDPSGFGSLASSSSSASSSSGVSSRCSADSDVRPKSRFQQMKQQSLKKLSSFKSQIATLTSGKQQQQQQQQRSKQIDGRQQDAYGVSTAPDGGGQRSNGMLPRIRASKSMQNLEQITRDSFYNLRDATSNLKQRYSSRLELRQAQPSGQYDELWDEDDRYDTDDDELGGHTYDKVRKSNQRRKYLEFVGL